jgi:hypothetical protein
MGRICYGEYLAYNRVCSWVNYSFDKWGNLQMVFERKQTLLRQKGSMLMLLVLVNVIRWEGWSDHLHIAKKRMS